ncbi:MAG: rhodanese-like domain-containing protein [Eubacteriales bacterium]
MSAQKITKTVIMFVVLLLFTLAGCSSSTEAETETVTYDQITAETAKMLMDTETNYIILDARTEDEYAAGHIPGAILMPEYEVADRAESELPDKNQLILVYCRSGRRSKIAAEALACLGYTNVKEFGGIIDWTYETTTD